MPRWHLALSLCLVLTCVFPRVVWTSVLRLLGGLLACAIVHLSFAYFITLRGAQRVRYAAPPPLRFTTPASWSSSKTKYEWTLSRTKQSEALHPRMPAGLAEVADRILADLVATYVNNWFDELTGPKASQAFPDAVERLVRHSLTRLIQRAERVDWPAFLVSVVVPRLTAHVHHFHDVVARVYPHGGGMHDVGDADEMGIFLANLLAGGGVSLHPAVGAATLNTRPAEEAHVRSMIDSLLHQVLPTHEYESKAVRIMTREIVTCAIVLPIIEKLSDPDFLNRLIEEKAGAAIREQKMVKELREALDATSIARAQSRRRKHSSGPAISDATDATEFEAFMQSIRRCASLQEARRLRSDIDISVRRTQAALSGTGDPPNLRDRRRMARLTVYLERLAHAQASLQARLAELGDRSEVPRLTSYRASAKPSVISSKDVLSQPEALSLFTEFMDRRRQLPLLEVYLAIDGLCHPLENAADDLVSDANSTATAADANLSVLRNAAAREDSPQLVDAAQLRSSVLSLRKQALQIIDTEHFPAFRRSDLFLRACALVQTPLADITDAKLPAGHPHDVDRLPFGPNDDYPNEAVSVAPGAEPVNSSTEDVSRSVQPRRPPLFSEDDEHHSMDLIQEQTIEAMQEALNTILETDPAGTRELGPKASDPGQTRPTLDRRYPSAGSFLQKQPSKSSMRSSSPAGPRPVAVSDPLPRERVPEAAIRSRLDLLSDGESVRSFESALLAPGRLISDTELEKELMHLSERKESLLGQIEVIDALMRKAELTGNVREMNILSKSYAALKREVAGIGFQQAQLNSQAAEHVLKPGHVRIRISGTTVSELRGKSVVLYIVEVYQVDDAAQPRSGWFVTRRYSEFYRLDQALRELTPRFRLPDLPSRKLAAALSTASIETRRKGLEQYLRALVCNHNACSSVQLRHFLSQANVTLPTTAQGASQWHGGGMLEWDGGRAFKQTLMTGMDDAFSGPMMDVVIQRLGQDASTASLQEEDLVNSDTLLTGTTNKAVPSTATTEGLTPFTAPLCDLLIETFDLKAADNWLRRQAILILMQQFFGGTIERRLRDAFMAAMNPQNFIIALEVLRESMLGGTSVETHARSIQQKRSSREAAERCLAVLMPALAASLLGRSNARRAAQKSFSIMQHSRLNKSLAYIILDDLISALFPGSDATNPVL